MSALAATLITAIGVIGTTNRFSNKLLGDNSIASTTPKIFYIYNELKDINLRPIYQRDIRWTLPKMSGFLNTIMYSGIVPEILLYKLSEEERDEYKYECIDGQHRLFTIYHFRSGKYVELPGKTKFLIYIEYYNEETSQTEHIFYEENDNTKEHQINHPSTKVSYLSKRERDDFDDFVLNIKTITKRLHINERREIFTALQNGIPVRNSDELKNFTNRPFIQYLSDISMEPKMRELLKNNCTRKVDRYWIQWTTKLWHFVNNYDNKKKSEIFTIGDSEIRKNIKKRNHPLLDTTPELLQTFDIAFNRFYNFLRSPHNENIKLNPTILFALFIHLMDSDINREQILTSHLPFISKNGMDKVHKNMWENTSKQEVRSTYFNEVLNELESYKTIKSEIERPSISKKLKNNVWKKYFKNDLIGNCLCGVELNKKGIWHAGHIKAWCKGGDTIVENLLPTCAPCNLEMGSQNAIEFFKNKI